MMQLMFGVLFAYASFIQLYYYKFSFYILMKFPAVFKLEKIELCAPQRGN